MDKFSVIKRGHTDQMLLKVPLVHNHNGGSVFTNEFGHDHFNPWKRKGEHPHALMEFIHDIGIPHTLVSDNVPEEMHGTTCKLYQIYHIKECVTVPHSSWQNLAKSSICELKKSCCRMMRQTGTPTRLWTYCMTWFYWICIRESFIGYSVSLWWIFIHMWNNITMERSPINV
jgi:hypothetical protein